jgi:hypothetical protein
MKFSDVTTALKTLTDSVAALTKRMDAMSAAPRISSEAETANACLAAGVGAPAAARRPQAVGGGPAGERAERDAVIAALRAELEPLKWKLDTESIIEKSRLCAEIRELEGRGRPKPAAVAA